MPKARRKTPPDVAIPPLPRNCRGYRGRFRDTGGDLGSVAPMTWDILVARRHFIDAAAAGARRRR